MRGALAAAALCLALAGCASNGNGLIGPGGGTSSGCFMIHDAGQPPRTICTK